MATGHYLPRIFTAELFISSISIEEILSDAHLNRHVELIVLPLWSENGGLAWFLCRLSSHLREPYFEHHFYLQQVLEVFFTAGKQSTMSKIAHFTLIFLASCGGLTPYQASAVFREFSAACLWRHFAGSGTNLPQLKYTRNMLSQLGFQLQDRMDSRV